MSKEPFFAKNWLDRQDSRREAIDGVLVETMLANSVFILISRNKLIVHDNERDYLFSFSDVMRMSISNKEWIFLGVVDGIHYYSKPIAPELSNNFKQIDLRTFMINHIDTDEKIGILAQACSIVSWHENYIFCPSCGGQLQSKRAGWRQDCLDCGKEHFPRIDPVVIMLVTNKDHCLLGSGRIFPHQRYSCLAGFMEPGETIENAAKRELFEETGVIGLDVHYCFSQPWPFPYSLMIGLHITAEMTRLKIDKNELVDARWFHKAEVAAVLNDMTGYDFTLPPKFAIARTLLEQWVMEY